MNHILQFTVTKEHEGGYSASCFEHGIFTQGETFEDLVSNIHEATELRFKDTHEPRMLSLEKAPFLLHLELPPMHA